MTPRLIVIGSSYGGIAALTELVERLSADLPAAVLVVQHVPRDRRSVLPSLLSRRGALRAVHPVQFELIRPGRIYVAPPDRHLLVTPDGRIDLTRGPEENRARPAIDATLRSAALKFGPAVIAAVLTGQLYDGTAGALAVKDVGGLLVVQDPAEAEAPSMPRSVLRHVWIDRCCALNEMADVLNSLAHMPTGAEQFAPFTSLLQIENRIAAGLLDAQTRRRLEALSTPLAYTCPVCGGPTRQLIDPRIKRYRCRVGHASWIDVSATMAPTVVGGAVHLQRRKPAARTQGARSVR